MPQAVFVGPSPQRTELDSRSIHVRFVVEKVTLQQICLQVLLFFAVNTIPPMLHFHFPLRVALTRRTNGRRLELSTKECSLGNWKTVDGRKDCES
jgi:hypothetical protein